MKKYTVEQINEMNLTELKKVAKNEFKLALSEKGKRFTKGQLIVKITSIIIGQEVKQLEKIEKQAKTRKAMFTVQPSKIETVVKEARTVLVKAKTSPQLKQAVKSACETLNYWKCQSNKQGNNMFQKAKIDKQVQLLSILLKPYAKKAGVKL